MMNAVWKFKAGLDVTLRWFCIVLFAVLVLLVVWQVFVRQVLNSGNPWTEIAARTVFIWQGLIGAAYVIGEKDDVAIDFLVRRFPEKAVKAVEIVAHLIVAAFAAWIMVWGGGKIVASSWTDIVQLLPVSQGQLYLVLPIAGGIIVLYSFIHIAQTFVKEVQVVDPNEIDLDKLTEEGI